MSFSNYEIENLHHAKQIFHTSNSYNFFPYKKKKQATISARVVSLFRAQNTQPFCKLIRLALGRSYKIALIGLPS